MQPKHSQFCTYVGPSLGPDVGPDEGVEVGTAVGVNVGEAVGEAVGGAVVATLGVDVGEEVGGSHPGPGSEQEDSQLLLLLSNKSTLPVSSWPRGTLLILQDWHQTRGELSSLLIYSKDHKRQTIETLTSTSWFANRVR